MFGAEKNTYKNELKKRKFKGETKLYLDYYLHKHPKKVSSVKESEKQMHKLIF